MSERPLTDADAPAIAELVAVDSEAVTGRPYEAVGMRVEGAMAVYER